MSDQAPTFNVKLNGASVGAEDLNRLKEIRITNYIQLPDVCSLGLAYPGMEGLDDTPFVIGADLEVLMGSADDDTDVPKSIFKGQITTLEPEFGAGGCAIAVRAYDRSQLLYRSRKSRSFQNMTATDIVTKIVQECGLTPACDSSGGAYDFMQQNNETDWDFILRLADRVGFEFVVEDKTAYFRRPTAEGAVELTWPDTLWTFKPRVTAVQQVEKVTLAAFDPKTKQAITSSTSNPNQIAEIGFARSQVTKALAVSDIHIATEPIKDAAEGLALAQSLLDKLANGYIAAEGLAPGNPAIKAGAKVKVSGIGQKFGGIYRVATATHVIKAGMYTTQFANSPSHTILGAVNGAGRNGSGPNFPGQIVIGLVTNNKDPDNMGRVRVKYPALGDDFEGNWARVASASAGNQRGLMMLPVPGEEVLIGFEHEDTTRPYVLGSLFSGADKPGDDLTLSQDGSFSLKSDHQIRQEAKEDITIKGHKQLVIEIDDAVNEKFHKAWTNKTDDKIDISAIKDMSLAGQNVNINGQGQVSISGNQSISISCGGSSISIGPSGVTISGPTISIG